MRKALSDYHARVFGAHLSYTVRGPGGKEYPGDKIFKKHACARAVPGRAGIPGHFAVDGRHKLYPSNDILRSTQIAIVTA